MGRQNSRRKHGRPSETDKVSDRSFIALHLAPRTNWISGTFHHQELTIRSRSLICGHPVAGWPGRDYCQQVVSPCKYWYLDWHGHHTKSKQMNGPGLGDRSAWLHTTSTTAPRHQRTITLHTANIMGYLVSQCRLRALHWVIFQTRARPGDILT